MAQRSLQCPFPSEELIPINWNNVAKLFDFEELDPFGSIEIEPGYVQESSD